MSLPAVTAQEQVQGQPVQPSHIPSQADNDMQAINLWLHGKSKRTVTAYKKQVGHFLDWIQNKPLRFVTLGDLQAYQDHLAESGFKETTQNAYIMTVKSLFTFTQKIGYTQFNPAAAIQGQKVKNELAQRILTEAEVQAMIHLEGNTRNKILLRFLYATGARASEVAGLKLKDFSECEGGATVTLFGKGGKTRHVMLPETVWTAIKDLHGHEIWPDKPAFVSRNKQGSLSAAMIWRIVKAAAKRAGVQKDVSPHFMRHSCASHSLDRGAPIHVVQSTLGHANLATTGRYTHVKPKESAGMWLAL